MSTTNKVVYVPARWALQKQSIDDFEWYTLRTYRWLWFAKTQAWFLTDFIHRYRVVDSK